MYSCGAFVGGFMDEIKMRYISMCLTSGQKDYDYEELLELSTKELRDLADKYNPKVIKQIQSSGEFKYVVIPKKVA